jgi:hypothetical protein
MACFRSTPKHDRAVEPLPSLLDEAEGREHPGARRLIARDALSICFDLWRHGMAR